MAESADLAGTFQSARLPCLLKLAVAEISNAKGQWGEQTKIDYQMISSFERQAWICAVGCECIHV